MSISHAEYMRQWRAKNPEKWRKIARKARDKWKRNNRDAHREAQRNHRYTVRREILDLLGGQKCVHCGYDKDWRALQIDHIHGGGKQDMRTRAAETNQWALRNWLRKHQPEARKKYQVLCCNCNWIKRYENGEHPGGKIVKITT